MNEETIDNFVDLLFNFDMKELENETKFLENYKKLQQENQQLKEQYCERIDCSGRIKTNKKLEQLQQRIDKAIEYIESDLSHIQVIGKRNRSYLLEILKGEENE